MASRAQLATFDEFWKFYLSEHAHASTRWLHFFGTTAAMTCLGLGIATRWHWIAWLALVVGYGPAWIAHFFIEHNRPATFKYPLRSLAADLILWWRILTRRNLRNG